jgi:hypothetical protein
MPAPCTIDNRNAACSSDRPSACCAGIAGGNLPTCNASATPAKMTTSAGSNLRGAFVGALVVIGILRAAHSGIRLGSGPAAHAARECACNGMALAAADNAVMDRNELRNRALHRRDVLRAGVAAAGVLSGFGCAQSTTAPYDWTPRLSGSSLVLLGEVHDNSEQHRLRAQVLRQAFEGGWRPVIVMEQFDLDHQADIDRARSERPSDAPYLIAQAGAAANWQWNDYQALVALALQYRVPLLAGNLPRSTASRLAREDYTAVLGVERVRAWRLADAPDAAWQAAQERESISATVARCHNVCGRARARSRATPRWRICCRSTRHTARCCWRNGHVRRDFGVPRLQRQGTPATLVVGFIERDTPPAGPGVYDAVVVTAPAKREDPCDAFKARPLPTATTGSSLERA